MTSINNLSQYTQTGPDSGHPKVKRMTAPISFLPNDLPLYIDIEFEDTPTERYYRAKRLPIYA